ncbi:hypothetical protein FOA43_003042 [Brettanomyces nanus]|uniref:Zn(2)-C6 fungal-type domain-containing protein n=1 Tax=Eeniella nana TaxID=13502 RepID=A0A875S458_EENNA|nr:uncharacterized protein FOA43_003042 [Brettanomyces nanus]QPG75683.1 hypothetical protein FOA43_003042 [Brettanomyces nanus]
MTEPNSYASGSAVRVKKTRNRVPTSCENCRRRKLKCDRRRPCSNCVRSQNESLCKYAVQPSEASPKTKLTNEIVHLKMKINKLEHILQMNNIDPGEYSDLSLMIGTDKSSSDSSSPDGEADPMVSLANKFDQLVIKGNHFLHSGTTSYMTFVAGDKTLSQLYEKYMEHHRLAYKEYLRRLQLKPSDFPGNCADSSLALLSDTAFSEMNACGMESLQLPGADKAYSVMKPSFNAAKDTLRILNKINGEIPPLFAVKALIDNFFNRVYYLLPFVDENKFRDELSRVLVETPNGGCRLVLVHIDNTSIISLLLILLRFSYLAVNVGDLTENPKLIDNAELIAMIKSNIDIGPSFIGLAKDLLMSLPLSENIFKKITPRNIQVLLFLRLYQSYSPELNEENQENAINLAMIIEMGRVMGSNRDPSNFPNVLPDERSNNISRRIYYELLLLDTVNSIEYGCPLIIQDDESAVDLPKLSAEDSQILYNFKKGRPIGVNGGKLKSVVVEKAVNTATALTYEATRLMREGIKAFQNVGDGTKKSNLTHIVRRMENFMSTKLPSLTALVRNTNFEDFQDMCTMYQIFKIPMIRVYELRLTMLSLLNCFYYLLYMNEDKGFSRVKTDYAVRATEISLSLFKNAYDYVTYYSESETLNGTSPSHIELRKFSMKLETFLVRITVFSTLKSSLWICSLFLNCVQDEGLDFLSILSKFGSSTDTLLALDWFNVDLADGTNEQYLFMLFHYMKQFYFKLFSLKDKFFCCWRSSMTLKLFINYFKDSNESQFKKFIDPNFMFNTTASTYEGLALPTGSSNETNSLSDTGNDTSNASLEDIVNNDLGEFLEGSKNDVNDILFDSMEDTINAIFADNKAYRSSTEMFSMFGNDLSQMETMFYDSNKSEPPTLTRNKTSSTGKMTDPSTSSLYSTRDERKSTTTTSSRSPFDTGHGTGSDIDTAESYIDDAPLMKDKQLNLADLLERLKQEPGFEI